MKGIQAPTGAPPPTSPAISGQSRLEKWGKTPGETQRVESLQLASGCISIYNLTVTARFHQAQDLLHVHTLGIVNCPSAKCRRVSRTPLTPSRSREKNTMFFVQRKGPPRTSWMTLSMARIASTRWVCGRQLRATLGLAFGHSLCASPLCVRSPGFESIFAGIPPA